MAKGAKRISKILISTTVVIALTTGCSSIMSSATTGLADSLTKAVLDQNDPETVRQGAPAYLLLIDGLIADDPKNVELLMAGASLYSSYAGAFVDDPERASRLSRKGRDYGWAAWCRVEKDACEIWSAPYEDFERVVERTPPEDIAVLFSAGAAWASWIRANTDDWSAIADKARVDAMMQRVVALDERYEEGSAFLYLGILATLLPEAMGGKPEQGREDFERVIELSDGRNLMAKVLLARSYARLVFDRRAARSSLSRGHRRRPGSAGFDADQHPGPGRSEGLLGSSEDYFGD